MGTSARPASGNGQPARELRRCKPAVIVNIQRQPGANIIGVVDEVQKLLPQLRSSLPASGEAAGADRPDEYDSGVGEGRAVFADADDRAGRHGDLPVPAVVCGDGDSFGRGAAVDCGHVRGDVSAGIQPEQPVADGADDLDRVSWWTTRS